MQELDPLVFLSVFQEMLGPWLWVLAAVLVVGLLAFITVLLRERRVIARRLMWSQLFGVAGGIAALIVMVEVSSSGYTDAGGPADWFLILLVFLAGLIGATILSYTIWGCRLQCKRRAS